MLRNQRGMLSADFLLSMIMASLLSILLLALASTYSVVEVAQYIAFSAARVHAAADVDISDQKAKAQAKLASLIKSNIFAPLFVGSGWFSLKLKDIKSGGHSGAGGNPSDSYDSDYPADQTLTITGGIPQVGIRLDFETKILNMNIGALGKSGDNNGSGYKAVITGFLIREPSQKECQDLMSEEKRFKNILKLDSRYQNIVNSKNHVPGGKYFPMEDNGC